MVRSWVVGGQIALLCSAVLLYDCAHIVGDGSILSGWMVPLPLLHSYNSCCRAWYVGSWGWVRYLCCRCSNSGVRWEPSPYAYQLRAVALTTGGSLHMVLLRTHCCCCELRAAGRAYSYLLLVEKSKRHMPTYLYCDTVFSLAIQASENNTFI